MNVYLDPDLLLQVLAPLCPVYVNSIVSVAQLTTSKRVHITPTIILVSERSSVSGAGGKGLGRTLTEQFALLIHVNQTAGDDADAGSKIRRIRAAAFELLEGRRLTQEWAPFLYTGGQLIGADAGQYRWAERYQTERGLYTGQRNLTPLIQL